MEFDSRVLSADRAAIAPDDQTLYMPAIDAVSGSRIRIAAYDLVAGRQKASFTLPDTAVLVPTPLELSPDGRWLAIQATNKDDGYVACFATDGSDYREVYRGHRTTMAGITWTSDSQSLLAGLRTANDKWQIVSIPEKGGTPVPTGLQFDSAPQFSLSLNADGSQLALSRPTGAGELWALDNVFSALK
jgi:hypothetical protein